MMDSLGEWILSLVGAAILCSAALAVTPDGMARRPVKLVCGIALMVALLGIVTKFDYGALAVEIGGYRQRAEEQVSDAVSQSSNETRFIIEARCEAYILDKATRLGADDIQVSVTARWSEQGYWYPAEAELSGEITEETRSELSALMAVELGIGTEEQTWNTDDEE